MADAGMNVTKFATKSHDDADEVRTPNKTRVEVVRLPGFTMGRLNFDPGWKWSECVKPVVGTDSCQVAHVGYAVSGRLTVRPNDEIQRRSRRATQNMAESNLSRADRTIT